MRKVTTSRVLQGAVELTGRLFSKISNDELPLFLASLDRNLREIWEKEFWPPVMTVEERWFREVWSAGTFAVDVEVYHAATDSYWVNSSGSATTGVPGTSSDWTELVVYNAFISFIQAGKTEIGQVYRLTTKDPRLKLSFDVVEYSQKDDQIVIASPNQNSYWVEFRKRAPHIKLPAKHSSTTSYEVGDQAYYTAGGMAGSDIYEALVANTNSAPGVVTANWAKIEIPYLFGPYLEHSIAADILLTDEKIELAGIQMRDRDRMLESEIRKTKNQSGDAFSPIFSTY